MAILSIQSELFCRHTEDSNRTLLQIYRRIQSEFFCRHTFADIVSNTPYELWSVVSNTPSELWSVVSKNATPSATSIKTASKSTGMSTGYMFLLHIYLCAGTKCVQLRGTVTVSRSTYIPYMLLHICLVAGTKFVQGPKVYSLKGTLTVSKSTRIPYMLLLLHIYLSAGTKCVL
ncbi:hypothetical protein BsWGS_21704 [Bradybaena similaris]